MHKKLISLIIVFIFLSSNFAIAENSLLPIQENNQDIFGRELTGESIYVEVAGYEPTIVPASVLNDQNVPVYVYLKGTTFGGLVGSDLEQAPLYGLPTIKNMYITPVGPSSNYVSGINYVKPFKSEYLSDNRFYDLGYLIVNLRKITNEDDLPNIIDLNLSARIEFELDNAYGDFGAQDLVLNENLNEEQWKVDPNGNFWGRSGYVRVVSLDDDKATIQVYDGLLRSMSKFTLKEGDESSPLLLRYGETLQNNRFRIRLNNIASSQDNAEIQIVRNGKIETKNVVKGSPIYYGSKWIVKDIIKEYKENIVYDVVVLEDSEGNLNYLYKFKKDEVVYSSLESFDSATFLEYKEFNNFGSIIISESKKYGLDPSLVAALIKQESNFNPNAKSAADAIGLMQLIPRTAKEVADKLGIDEYDLENPQDNIEMGVYYLDERITRWKSITLALAAYNGGDAANELSSNENCKGQRVWECNANEGYKETRNYVPSVLGHYNTYASLFGATVSTTLSSENQQSNGIAKGICDSISDIELKDINIDTDYKKVLCSSINELKDYISKYGESNVVNYYLGLDYLELGDYDEARNYFNAVARGDPYYDLAQDKLKEVTNSESGFESYVLYLDDENVQLTLKSIDLNQESKTKIKIKINGITEEYSVGGNLRFNGDETNWYLDEIGSNYIVVKAKFSGETAEREKRLFLERDTSLALNDKENFVATLQNIESKREAYLTILPGTGRALSESNFMVHIPVEDYGFKFSDEQIDAQINWTENAIEDLSKVIDTLDDVIQWGNKLCWSFWGLFTLYNIFTPDQRTARNAVMNGINGKGSIKEFCSINTGSGKYTGSYDECIFKNREQINNLMDSYEDAIDKVDGTSESGFKKEDFKFIDSKGNEQFIYQERDIKEYQRLSELNANLESQNLEGGVYDHFNEGLNSELINRETSLNNAKDAVNSATTAVSNYEGTNAEKYLLWKEVYDGITIQSSGQTSVNTVSDFGFTLDNVYSDDTINYHFDDNNVRVDLEPYTISDYKTFLNDQSSSEDAKKELSRISNLKSTDQAVTSDGLYLYKFNNKIIASYTNSGELRTNYAGDATVHILDNGKVKRYPIGNGDYVEVVDYYANGQPKDVEKWNVGRDGLLGTSDDVPLMSSDRLNLRENLNEKDNLRRKVSNAGTCESGEFTTVAGVGKFLCDSADAKLQKQLSAKQCTDVFSIEQCQVLFNFCDPVMCPASRFNLGGKYEVSNVVQTGLIGSIVLGLPNWAPISGTAQVIPPICLTGVSSSAKSYRSMLEGYNECLKVSKERGENVGICEKIRSVFWCELAWREASAIGDALIKVSSPTDIYNYLGSSGGGEYSNLQSAATYVSDSSSFFTKEYAKNAFAAYKARSTAEIGTQICQAFIGAKGPNFGEFFDELTKPESPPQFTAYFDEKLWSSDAGYTTANSEFGLGNIEEQSLYNVYYHIYAGEDQDARYTVFLRDDYGNVAYVTDRAGGSLGFIPKGGFADKNIDFIGRSGYKEICVVINGNVECGFGKSSTGFGLNRLSDELVNSDSNRQITSKEQCVPEYTGPSTNFGGVPLVLPTNVPGVTTQNGIVRLCSIKNPGEGVNPDDYDSVGTCGSDNIGRNLGDCWIDLRTVTRAIKSTDIREDVTAREGGGSLTIDDALAKEIYDNLESQLIFTEDDYRGHFETSTGDFVFNTFNVDFRDVINQINNLVEVQNKLQTVENSEEGSYRDLANYNFGNYGKLSKIRIGQVYYAIGKYLKDKQVVNAEAESTVKNIASDFISPLPVEAGEKTIDSNFGCEFEYIDGSLLTRSIIFKFNEQDGVWYWKESNPTLFSDMFGFGQVNYAVVDTNSLGMVLYTYNNIFEGFLSLNSPTYNDGIEILLSYANSNQDHVLNLYKDGKLADESAFERWSELCEIEPQGVSEHTITASAQICDKPAEGEPVAGDTCIVTDSLNVEVDGDSISISDNGNIIPDSVVTIKTSVDSSLVVTTDSLGTVEIPKMDLSQGKNYLLKKIKDIVDRIRSRSDKVRGGVVNGEATYRLSLDGKEVVIPQSSNNFLIIRDSILNFYFLDNGMDGYIDSAVNFHSGFESSNINSVAGDLFDDEQGLDVKFNLEQRNNNGRTVYFNRGDKLLYYPFESEGRKLLFDPGDTLVEGLQSNYLWSINQASTLISISDLLMND